MLSDLFLVNLVSFSSFKCFDFNKNKRREHGGRNWLVSPCRDLISFTLVFNIHVDTLKGSEGKFKDRFYKYQKYLVRCTANFSKVEKKKNEKRPPM